MDLSPFVDATIAGVPLVAVVLGLVEMVKRLGLKGDALLVVSMLIGLALGGCYLVASVGMPVTFAGWFGVVVYGLGCGLVASGIYDAATGRNRPDPSLP